MVKAISIVTASEDDPIYKEGFTITSARKQTSKPKGTAGPPLAKSKPTTDKQ